VTEGTRREASVRLFVGLRPAFDDAARLASWAAGALLPLDDRLRLTDRASLHVTLVFLGAVAETRVAEALELTSRPALQDRTATFAPTGVRAFGTALALTLQPCDDARWVGESQGRLAGELVEAGLAQAEERPWSPHLTLARVPGRRRPRPRLPDPPADLLRVEGVSLFRSRPGPRGSTYERLDP